MSGHGQGDADLDEDADYQFALRLSAELNQQQGSSSKTVVRHADYDEHADYTLAMQLEWEMQQTEAQTKAKKNPPYSPYIARGASVMSTSTQSAWQLGEENVRIANYEPETASRYCNLDTFAELTSHLKSIKCRRCEELFFQSELDIRSLFQNWVGGTVEKLSSFMRCTSCGTSSCLACTPEPFAKSSRIGLRNNNRHVSWCCVGGRLFLIWTLLCGFDRCFWESRSGGVLNHSKDRAQRSSRHTKKPPRGGVGFGGRTRPVSSYMPSGMGYESKLMDFGEDWDELMIYDHPHFQSTSHTQDPSKAPPPAAKEEDGVLKAKSAQKSEDVFGRLVLGFLAGLLPSLDRETCFDIAPPAAVFEMLMDSKILVYCAELLRNDSLEDVVKRKDLFQTLFQFLTIVGSHSATSQVLVIPRPVRPDSIDLLTLSFCVPPPHKDTTQSLTECLRNLATQSTLVLQSVKNNEDDFQTEEGQEMLCICRQISGLAQHIQSNITMEAGDAKTTRATDLVISDVEDKLLLSTHYHASKATSLTYSQPGRFKRLITEISTLQTGLPPGIFVRYCENRPDVLKCIIIGPRGSPYENGLFEFDIFCGADFPTSPPQVNFKGTGGGRVSINPNLYADGKVCLSLLGTWSGEPWKPNESTLLQVLISIQAMILCEEPWYNEPGREAGYSDSENGPSARYNKTIREHTVRYAILNWLDKPPQLWQEVVDQHFRRNCNAVLKTVEDWTKAKAAPVPPRKRFADFADEEYYDYDELMSRRGSTLDKADMGTMLNRLKTELQRYGATFVVQYVPPPVVQQHPAPHPGSSQHLPSSVQTLSPIVPSPSLLYSSFHPLPGYMPPLHTPHTPSLPHLQGHSFRGGFWGRGQVLENEPGGQSAALVTPNFRGGSVQRGSSDVPTSGRYETRSTTRGRGENDMMSGGRSVLSGPSNGRGRGAPRGRGAGESAGNFYPASFGSNNSNGQRGHGGRGDRGGRGGRGAPSS